MHEVEYLTATDVVALAELFFEERGYARPILNANGRGLFESAVHRAETAAYYEDRDLIRRAAALCDGITTNHAFVDGSKRAAWIACVTFLSDNGYELRDGDDAAFASRIIGIYDQTDHSDAVEQLAAWLREHLTGR